MSNIKIYGEKQNDVELDWALRLLRTHNGVDVLAVDPNTGCVVTRGSLFNITKGTTSRYRGVNANLGLALDEEGRVKVEDKD